jgi:glutaredoxin
MLTVYSRPNCGYCQSAKNWLRDHDLAFTVIDVLADPLALAFLKRQGHGSVPQIYLDDTPVADGFFGLRALGAERLRHRLAQRLPTSQPSVRQPQVLAL